MPKRYYISAMVMISCSNSQALYHRVLSRRSGVITLSQRLITLLSASAFLLVAPVLVVELFHEQISQQVRCE